MSKASSIHEITNGTLCVKASTRGAELQSIRGADGTEYLWQGDPRYWSDRALTIFPYVARLTEGAYTYRGRRYALPIHGFAPGAEFEPEIVDPDHMRFTLEDSAQTRAVYPFRFRFNVSFRLSGASLITEYIVENRGDDPMFFGTGVHPGFNVPLEPGVPFESYRIEFGEPCLPRRVRFTPDCFVAGGDDPFPLEDGRRLGLRHDLFNDDAIILRDTPRRLTLSSPRGKRSVTFEYPTLPLFGLWHWPRKDAPYVCLEAWSSLPSRQGVVEDLERQDDLVRLPAGETWRTAVTVTFG